MAVITYREALTQALAEEMRRDDNVFIFGEDVAFIEGTFRVTKGLLAEFGERRVRDTPIAETAIAGLAVGAAMAGLRPVAEMMTWNFALVAMDQLVNHIPKVRLMSGGQFGVPCVIRGPQGGRGQKAAQHSQSLEAFWMHMPGVRVVIPATPYDAKGLLKSAIRSDDPVFFLEHEQLYAVKGEVPDEEYLVPMGKAAIAREGDAVTIVTYSFMLHECLKAAEQLSEEGIEAEVIDLRTLNPLDIESVVRSVRKTGRVAIAHEAWRTAGAGAEIATQIYDHCFAELQRPIVRIAGVDAPAPYNKELERKVYPWASDVFTHVLEMF